MSQILGGNKTTGGTGFTSITSVGGGSVLIASNTAPNATIKSLTAGQGIGLIASDTEIQINSQETVQQIYANSTYPQLITSAAHGPFVMRRGTAADADVVLQIENGGAQSKANILGDGSIQSQAGFNLADSSYNVRGSFYTTATDAFVQASVNRTISLQTNNGNVFVRAGGLFSISMLTNAVTRMTIDSTGLVSVAGLAGTGNRIVSASATGGLQVTAYTLPLTDGTANQKLTTNGAGVLSWTNSNLQTAYDNSTTDPQILTSVGNGAFSLRRGSAADTDAVFQVENNAGTSNANILGNGSIQSKAGFNLADSAYAVRGSFFTTATDVTINATANRNFNVVTNNGTINLTAGGAFAINMSTNAVTRMSIGSTGTVNIAGLAGTGTRVVTASATGDLGSQATGNVSELTSGILTFGGATNAVLGTGLTITVTKADTTHDGYLSSTDWNSFNTGLTNAFKNGLNAFGAASNLGNSDNFGLNIKTNNLTRIAIAAGGAIQFNSAYTFPTADGTANYSLVTNGSGSLSFLAHTLQVAYNLGTDPFITTDATRGAVTIRRGSAADSDAILMFENGTPANVARVLGTGAYQSQAGFDMTDASWNVRGSWFASATDVTLNASSNRNMIVQTNNGNITFQAGGLFSNIFKTNGIIAGKVDSAQNLQMYGNTTDGGGLQLTQVTTGKTGSSTFDVLRFLDQAGSVITGPIVGTLVLSIYDQTTSPKGAKTIIYRLCSTGEGTTNVVFNLADQAQTSSNIPFTSAAVVADGGAGGIKVQVTTSASANNAKIIATFYGAFCRN